MKTWNNENARVKVEELYALSEGEREVEATLISEDLKKWAQSNFQFSERQIACMDLLPKEYYDETGFLMARAIVKKHPIDIFVTDDSTPVAARKRGDKVEGGWSQKDGFNVKYTFEF